jgi:hypothetical protein
LLQKSYRTYYLAREAEIEINMVDATKQEVLITVDELTKLYEHIKKIVIPIEEFTTLCNEEAINDLEVKLKEIEAERDAVYHRLFKEVTVNVSSGIFPLFNMITLATHGISLKDIAVEGEITKNIYNLARILRVSKILFEKYKDKNIEVYPRIFLPEHGCIDIFVRFPSPYRKFALIALSSVGIGHRAYFSPKHNRLFDRLTRGSKARKEYDSSKADDFKTQEVMLRKYHRHLLGSLRESKKPMVKIFTLCNPYKPPTEEDASRSNYHETKFTMEFPEERWAEIGSKKFPFIRTEPMVLAVTEEMIGDLIDCWLE